MRQELFIFSYLIFWTLFTKITKNIGIFILKNKVSCELRARYNTRWT